MNIDSWRKQNDSVRYEAEEIERSQKKAEQRRKEQEADKLSSSCQGVGLSDNDGW